MNGISLEIEENNKYLDLVIQPADAPDGLKAKSLIDFFNDSAFSTLYLFEDNVQNAIAALGQAKIKNTTGKIVERIAERKDAVVKFKLSDGDMLAHLSITTAYGGKTPNPLSLVSAANKQGIVRGVSSKRIEALYKQAKMAKPGETVEDIIAKGLPAKNGKPSKLRPLVPNALERILKPQETGTSRIDMRNLGDVICVKTGTPLLRRLPPTKGRHGYAVSGAEVTAKEGQWVKFRPGDGTALSDNDENLLIAAITGMPKFKDQKMWVDDTFTCNGVNVGTGNVNYDGAVLVNGDVTEKMVIIASGDVTINGFVESATIHAGGDIIITEGAMGKVNDANTTYSTKLVAQGSIHVQHGQGLDISCSGSVTVGRQLAYSRIVCGGGVTVGPVDNPNGNLFACDIQSNDKVVAGTLGAVSGSNLNIDFSAGFNTLLERKDTLDELLKLLMDNNSRHQDKMELIRSKRIHADLRQKYEEAEEMLKSEMQLMQWLQLKAEGMKEAKDLYQEEIKLIANKRLYPGVVVKLNNRTWRAEREYAKACVSYEGHQWKYEPIL